jgi:hypothetical protein
VSILQEKIARWSSDPQSYSKEIEVPHLLKPRIGWENERLAAYLLSRFSFLAQPSSIADDFFCTIFKTVDLSGRDALIPRSSFAIQVKSSESEVSTDNKIDYLLGLELPFFIGVVRQSPPEMNIYSAELLPLLFSERGKPDRLWLAPVARSGFDPDRYFEDVGPKEYRLRCPLVVTLSIDDDRSTLASKVDALLRICSRTHSNIATRVNEEHIYDVDGNGRYRIMAGSGSVHYFQSNFVKRLGEYFYNLLWILNAQPNKFSVDEFQLFETFYRGLESLYGIPLPEYVSTPYHALKAKLIDRSV